MTKKPNKPGLYWAALDDGNGDVDVRVLRVEYYSGETSFQHGAVCKFVDGSEIGFDVKDFDQELVQPSKTVYAASRGAKFFAERKLTWYGEVKPPKAARVQKALTL